ncbi:MAG: hypothetical protein M9918_17975 [Anaerolineae bacterium]|nr:hypothetical protein [Anaerolineae bacterium]
MKHTIPYLQRDQKPLVFAHRGASGRLPENTLPAFQMAAWVSTGWNWIFTARQIVF